MLKRWRSLWAWRAPRTLKITRSGRVFLVITIGVGLSALNTGNNLLYLILGLMLSLIITSGILSERCLRWLRVRRILPDAAHAAEPFALRYEVIRDRGYAFALTLTELSGGLDGAAFIPIVGPREPVVARAQMTAEHRGPHPLAEVEVSTTFPFGIFLKTRRVELEDQLLVFPRRGFACVEPAEALGAPAGDGGNPYRRDGTGDLLGLRELQHGEDARRVHWLKSAAAGKLLKVEREREERRQFVLRVSDGVARRSARSALRRDRRAHPPAALARSRGRARSERSPHSARRRPGARRLRARAAGVRHVSGGTCCVGT